VARLADHRESLSRVTTARERAPDPADFHAKIEESKETLAEMQVNEPARLTDALIAGDDIGTSPVAAAEAEIARLESELSNARQVRELLAERERAVLLKIDYAERGVRNAIADILRADEGGAVARLLFEYRAAQDRVAECFKCLEAISRRDGMPSDSVWKVVRLPNMISANSSMIDLIGTEAALRALETNAEVELHLVSTFERVVTNPAAGDAPAAA